MLFFPAQAEYSYFSIKGSIANRLTLPGYSYVETSLQLISSDTGEITAEIKDTYRYGIRSSKVVSCDSCL